MAAGLKFFLCGVKKDPGRGGINPDIGITNSIECLTGTFSSHDANNIGRDASIVQGSVNNTLSRCRGKGGRKDFRFCIINQGVFIGSKEYLSCLVFLVTFFVKVVDSFDKLVSVCGFLVSLEDILDIF